MRVKACPQPLPFNILQMFFTFAKSHVQNHVKAGLQLTVPIFNIQDIWEIFQLGELFCLLGWFERLLSNYCYFKMSFFCCWISLITFFLSNKSVEMSNLICALFLDIWFHLFVCIYLLYKESPFLLSLLLLFLMMENTSDSSTLLHKWKFKDQKLIFTS